MHSILPRALNSSAAAVLDQVIYNFGGDYSHHSVLWCDLGSIHQPKWSPLDLKEYSFKGDED